MSAKSDILEEKLQQLKGVEPPDAIGQDKNAPEPKPKERKVDTRRSEAAEEKLRAVKLQNDATKLQNDGVEQHQKREQTDHEKLWEFRTHFGIFAKWNVAVWQGCILVIVVLNGTCILKIDQTVLLALITTTTVNVFAFLIIVMKFVFARPATPKPDTK